MLRRIAKIRARESAKKFRRELRKSVLTAIVAAFGFLIALSWRDVISEWVKGLAQMSPIQGNLVSAIIITVISVIGIFIVTKLLAEKEEK